MSLLPRRCLKSEINFALLFYFTPFKKSRSPKNVKK